MATFVDIERRLYGSPVTTDGVLDESSTLLRQRVGRAPVVRPFALCEQACRHDGFGWGTRCSRKASD